MFLLLLITIVGINQPSPNPINIKGTNGLSYRLFVNQDKLCFQYKLGRNWSEPTRLDSGNISEYTVAITPGDYLHIVWTKQGRVYYKTNIYPVIPKDTIQWERFVIISPYFTEPASNLSVNTCSKFIFVDWSAPSEDALKRMEKWRRARWLDRPPFNWETPECLNEPLLKR
jgi:hypothetical protein